jgi:predicted DNA-binding transcriptional regulator YafY
MTTEVIRTAICTRQIVRLEYSDDTASAYVLEPYALFYVHRTAHAVWAHLGE